ncbi:amino acid adenylation domain-containing protein [Micromonospora sp. NPDC047557]|uniref:non-ribosomal peptide synthetase n=1 Tax=Micromonospora sp. NPDC047557 TaxID=3364250 RepID=UPI00371A5DDB
MERFPADPADIRPGTDAPSVADLIERRVAHQPDAVAVSDADVTLTYRDLDRAAARLTWRLHRAGVRPDEPVALCLPRGAALVVAALAVLRAGAAYLPLDPDQPVDRLRLLLAHSGARILLIPEAAGPGPDLTAEHVLTAGVATTGQEHPRTAAPAADRLAYLVHTSGSTGTPKAVAVPHRGLSNLVAWHVRTYRIGPGDRTAQVASPGFDAAVWEIWPSLAAGCSIHVVPDEIRIQPAELLRWMVRQEITVSFLPTPLAAEVMRLPAPPGLRLRTLLTGGDRLTSRPSPDAPYQVVNHYGPSEASVVATAAGVGGTAGGLPPIGTAIDGVRAHVLDDDMNPVTGGVPGELCIGGAGLARGYAGQPGATAARFRPDPFGPPGGRLYLTGDRVRRDHDGVLHFLGRRDDQVKLRGFRIEPGEVEACLRDHDAVREAVVVPTAAGTSLIAYVQARPGRHVDTGDVREHLGRHLPSYMVPDTVVAVGEFRLTRNGKLDREALRDVPEPEPDGQRVQGPRDALEQVIASAWTDVLGSPPERVPDVQTSFFHSGGHSLLAHQLMARVNDALGLVMPVQLLFEAPSIAALAEAARALAPDTADEAARLAQHIARLSEDEIDRLLAEYEKGTR